MNHETQRRPRLINDILFSQDPQSVIDSDPEFVAELRRRSQELAAFPERARAGDEVLSSLRERHCG